VKREGDDVLIIVSDSGVGIPKDEMQKLFAKFYRGRNVMEQGIEGTGLGLFITRAILRRHGGDITVTSEENKGTTFRMSLPVDPTRVPTGDVPIEEAVV
jgi:signal transduction histidine kinase